MPAQGSPAVWCRQARGTREVGQLQVWNTGNGTDKCRAGGSLRTCPLPLDISGTKKTLGQDVSRVGVSTA